MSPKTAVDSETPGARLRAVLTERHDAFVEEMWALFERTVAQLEEEVRALRAEKEQLQQRGTPGFCTPELTLKEPECVGLQPDGPDCGGLQPDDKEGPDGGGSEIDHAEELDSVGLQVGAVERFKCGGLLPDPKEGHECGGLQPVEPDCGGLQPGTDEGLDHGALQPDDEEGPDCGGTKTDPKEELDSGGLQAEAEERLECGGLRGGVLSHYEEGPDCGGLQTERLRRSIVKRMMMMKEPRIVLKRCDAKPTEDPNSAELTENSSDSDEDEHFLQPKKTKKKSTAIAEAPSVVSDSEAASDVEAQLDELLLEVTILTDSGDEEEDDRDTQTVEAYQEDFEIIPEMRESPQFDMEQDDRKARQRTPQRNCAGSPNPPSRKSPRAKERYDCPTCGISLVSKSDLRTHTASHSTAQRFECTECGVLFKHKTNLYRHKKIHLRTAVSRGGVRSPKRSGLVPCSVPLKDFLKSKSSQHGKTHKRREVACESEDTCELCQEKFSSKEHLKKHVHSHKSEGKFRCFECEKAFDYYSDVIRHLVSHKSWENVFEKDQEACTSESKSSPSSASRKKLFSKGESKNKSAFSCSVCGRRYAQKCSLNRHHALYGCIKKLKDSKVSKKASPGKLRCSVCLKEFSLPLNFYKHVMLHPTKTCLVCGKVSARPALVRRHMLTHTKEQLYRCPKCNKHFAKIRGLADHLRSFHQ